MIHLISRSLAILYLENHLRSEVKRRVNNTRPAQVDRGYSRLLNNILLKVRRDIIITRDIIKVNEFLSGSKVYYIRGKLGFRHLPQLPFLYLNI